VAVQSVCEAYRQTIATRLAEATARRLAETRRVDGWQAEIKSLDDEILFISAGFGMADLAALRDDAIERVWRTGWTMAANGPNAWRRLIRNATDDGESLRRLHAERSALEALSRRRVELVAKREGGVTAAEVELKYLPNIVVRQVKPTWDRPAVDHRPRNAMLVAVAAGISCVPLWLHVRRRYAIRARRSFPVVTREPVEGAAGSES
jgi:hypothetical protein